MLLGAKSVSLVMLYYCVRTAVRQVPYDTCVLYGTCRTTIVHMRDFLQIAADEIDSKLGRALRHRPARKTPEIWVKANILILAELGRAVLFFAFLILFAEITIFLVDAVSWGMASQRKGGGRPRVQQATCKLLCLIYS